MRRSAEPTAETSRAGSVTGPMPLSDQYLTQSTSHVESTTTCRPTTECSFHLQAGFSLIANEPVKNTDRTTPSATKPFRRLSRGGIDVGRFAGSIETPHRPLKHPRDASTTSHQ